MLMATPATELAVPAIDLPHECEDGDTAAAAAAAEVKWAKHYCSAHEILLVGEGDFSFALSLARSFGSAANITATSLDSHEAAVRKYAGAASNLEILTRMGSCVLFGVDATAMHLHHGLRNRRFDRIVFNFPHGGFTGREEESAPETIALHRALMSGFFRSSAVLIRRPGGEVHVTHKTGFPYGEWGLEKLASWSSLAAVGALEFSAGDYPGYTNRRGGIGRPDESFNVGKCRTFMFEPSPFRLRRAPASTEGTRRMFLRFLMPNWGGGAGAGAPRRSRRGRRWASKKIDDRRREETTRRYGTAVHALS